MIPHHRMPGPEMMKRASTKKPIDATDERTHPGIVLALVICFGSVFGCGREGPAEVRIQNASNAPFDSVLVDFSGQREFYGLIEAGEATGYRAVSKAYRCAYVEVHFADGRGVIQPIDYVGEKPLEPGRYTYRLTLNPNANSEWNRVNLEFVTDG